MTHPFGGPVQLICEDVTTSAHENMDLVRQTLAGLDSQVTGILRIYRPPPTAAFSPRDTTSQHFNAAAEAVRSHGFEPVERRAGGQLAIYDENALIIDLIAPHADPREHRLKRFDLFAQAIVSAFAALSIDARVGELAGEYCPGKYSVNGVGRVKLAGLAQRIGRRGYHLGVVISVLPSEKAKAAVTAAYQILGIPFDPITFGAVADLAPGLSYNTIRDMVLDAVAARVDVRA